MSFFKWSKTANNNANADGTINWAEGQAPSTVNDSARAMMAAAAKYRDDIAGVTTGGTATAYTVASNQAFDSLVSMDGKSIALVPHVTSGAGPVTLNVDGLGAKALRSAPGVELAAGTLISGTPYVARYVNSASEWILCSFFGKHSPRTADSVKHNLLGQATICRFGWFQFHGSNSAIRLCGISAMRASTSASHACGSTSLSLAVMISVAIAAARSAPRSEPAKSHDLRPSANPRRARSAALFVRQTLPSSMNRANRSQRLSM